MFEVILFPAWLNKCLNWKLYNSAEKRLWHSLFSNYVQNGYSQDHLNTAISALTLCECSLLILKNCCLWIVKYWSNFFVYLQLPLKILDGIIEGQAWLTRITFWLCFMCSAYVIVNCFTEGYL